MATSGEDDLCPLADLPRYSCGHCSGTDARAREQAGRRVTMTAPVRGPLRLLRRSDPPGDRIRRVPDGVDRVHAGHDLDA
jgi:hypothetical protein